MSEIRHRAEVYFQPNCIPSTDLWYEGWVFCDDCPDPVYGPDKRDRDAGEAYVCGACWDSQMRATDPETGRIDHKRQDHNCEHLIALDMDGAQKLWIVCDSEGWGKE